jgi:hypothetical protein
MSSPPTQPPNRPSLIFLQIGNLSSERWQCLKVFEDRILNGDEHQNIHLPRPSIFLTLLVTALIKVNKVIQIQIRPSNQTNVGFNDVYQIEHATGKQNITMINTFTASGRVLSPMLILYISL